MPEPLPAPAFPAPSLRLLRRCLGLIVATSAFSLTLTGCDNKTKTASHSHAAHPLHGKWSTTNLSQWPHPAGIARAIEFRPDGQIIGYLTYTKAEGEETHEPKPGEEDLYTVSGAVITTTRSGHPTGKYEYSIAKDGALTFTILENENPEFIGVKYVYETRER